MSLKRGVNYHRASLTKVLWKSYESLMTLLMAWRYEKGAWNIGHGDGVANGEHEGHEDKNTHEIGW